MLSVTNKPFMMSVIMLCVVALIEHHVLDTDARKQLS